MTNNKAGIYSSILSSGTVALALVRTEVEDRLPQAHNVIRWSRTAHLVSRVSVLFLRSIDGFRAMVSFVGVCLSKSSSINSQSGGRTPKAWREYGI